MPEIKIEGFTKLNKELKQVDKELPKALKKIAKDAAEIVAQESRGTAPVLSGALKAKIKTGATQKGAQVKITGLPYAAPIVFGWRAHNIKPNPFIYDALDKRRGEVEAAFNLQLAAFMDEKITPGVN
jgi:hypothetical protein